MWENLITKYIRRKFFNKILLSYTIIVLLALTALAMIVSENTSTMIS